MSPRNHSVSGATLPAKELKLIWAGYRSTVSGGLGCRSLDSILSRGGSSSYVMRRKTLEAQRWPLWYFSSQLKHSLRSLCEAISFRDNCFTVGGEGRLGKGSKGGGGTAWRGGGGKGCDDRPHGTWRVLRSFSSWSRARPAAWTRVKGWCAWTSRRISGVKPETEQLSKKGGGRLMMRLARSSKSDRYCATVPFCVNLNKAPVGSSYWEGAKRV